MAKAFPSKIQTYRRESSIAKKQNIIEDETAQVILANTNDDPPLGQVLEFIVSSALEHEKRKHLRTKLDERTENRTS